jgi:hypothetical protein
MSLVCAGILFSGTLAKELLAPVHFESELFSIGFPKWNAAAVFTEYVVRD